MTVNCNMQYRCVKYNVRHDPGKCKFDSNSIIDKNKLYCANCKSFGYPASYRGYPTLIDIKKRFIEGRISKQSKEPVLSKFNNYVKNHSSYAEAFKENKQYKKSSTPAENNQVSVSNDNKDFHSNHM